jgi:tetratricopeptide (TPR) repeat protein
VRAAGPLALLTTALIVSGCAPALREPPPVTALGGARVPPAEATPRCASVEDLLSQAETRFGRRPDASQVAAARELFLAAARADESGVSGLIGAARASAWLIEHEQDGARRAALATEVVQACQWCLRRAPTRVECTYRLALALGQQARERPSTAADALPRIVALLEQVIAADPLLDRAGGHRVLALTLLRAPGWPAGPGDPDAGLEHARQADALVPEHPANLLVLGEALAKTGDTVEASRVYERAEALARAAVGNPDAGGWAESASAARAALPQTGR